MEAPNAALLYAYGNLPTYLRNLEKVAQMPTAMRMLAPAATAAVAYADHRHQERQLLEAALMNQMFRELESQRMAPVVQGFQGGTPMTTHGQAAQQLNQMAAYRAMMSLQDPGMVRYASAAGKTMAKQASMSKEGLGPALAAALPAIKGLGARLLGGAGLRAAAGAGARALGGAGGRAAAAGRGLLPAAAGAAKRKPLIGMGTKAKLVGGAGLLGAGYVGLKGAQGVRDYMMQPTYTSSSWGGQGLAPGQLTEYGYAPHRG